MSNLVMHASAELEAAGLFSKDSDYDGMLGEAVMALVKVFAAQGHSGASAQITLDLFNLVARFKPLGPLTGEDSEWIDVAEEGGEPLFQNRRCSRVFKVGKEGQAYDIDGRVFREPSGICYTRGRESRVPVTFPYTPVTEYVDVPAEEGGSR